MDTALRRLVPPLPSVARLPEGQVDAAQEFVNRLRAAAPQFAAAAGAESAVVREVVPPARHRRERCRVVLRGADGGERDLTFLGTVSRQAAARPAFETQIREWLAAAPLGEAAGLVPDDEAPDGQAVDLTAWTAPPSPAAGLATVAMPALAPGAGLPTAVMAVPVAG